MSSPVERETVVGDGLTVKETSLRRMEEEKARKRPSTESRNDEMTFELFTSLENEIKVHVKKAEEYIAEIASLKKINASQEKALTKLNGELEEVEDSTSAAIPLANQVRLLTKRIEELQEENKTLARIQRVKTNAIEQLAEELEKRGRPEDYIITLQNELKLREREVQDLEDEKRTLKKIQERKDHEIVKMASSQEEGPFSVKSWKRERDALIKKAEDADKRVAQMEKSVKAGNARVNALMKRQETFVSIMKDMTTRKGNSTPFSPKRPSTASSRVQSSPREAGAGADTSDPPAEDMVSGELYMKLEKAVVVYKAKLAEKESAAAEKDDQVELLEKKVAVLTKSQSSLQKRLKMSEAAGATEIAGLKEQVEKLDADLLALQRRMEALQHTAAADLKQSAMVEADLRQEITALQQHNVVAQRQASDKVRLMEVDISQLRDNIQSLQNDMSLAKTRDLSQVEDLCAFLEAETFTK